MNRECDPQNRHVECAAYFVPVVLPSQYFPIFADNHEFCLQIPGLFPEPESHIFHALDPSPSREHFESPRKCYVFLLFSNHVMTRSWKNPRTLLLVWYWPVKELNDGSIISLVCYMQLDKPHSVEVLMQVTFVRSWVRDQRKKCFCIRCNTSAEYEFQPTQAILFFPLV